MKFLLIIFVSYHIDGGVATQKLEFNSEIECITAKQTIISDFEKTPRRAGFRSITASCVKRGNSDA